MKYFIYQLSKKTLFIITFCISCFAAKAQFGSYISYTAIDSIKYEVVLTVFRDCNGSPAGNTATVEVFGKSSGPFKATLNKVSTKDITGINPKCPQKSKCSGSYAYGVEEIVYKDTVDISGGSCNYEFRYSNCCRPSSITNGPANTNHFNIATINKCYGLNTAAQLSKIRILIASGQDFKGKIFIGDTINTQDSIVYSLVRVLTDIGKPASYSGVYDHTRPITFLGFPNKSLNLPAGFHFDRETSEFAFRPTKNNQVAVFCVEAKEFRKINGVMQVIGTSRVEYVNAVISSPNNKTPYISGQSVIACAGATTSITLEAKDIDKKDTTFLDVVGLPQGATVTYSRKGNNALATVTWTPKQSDISNIPYTFTATASDDACPLSGFSSKGFSFTVRKAPKANDVKVVSKQASCSSAEIIIEIDSSIKKPIISMTDEDSLSFGTNDTSRLYFKGSGWKKFFVKVKNQSFCDYTLVDSVFINPQYNLQLNTKNDSTVCPNQSFMFFTNALNGTASYSYLWQDINTNNTVSTASTFSVTMGIKNLHYKLLVADSNYCIGYDSVKMSAYELSIIKVGNKEIEKCPNKPFQLSASHVSGPPIKQFHWVGVDTLPIVTAQLSKPGTFTVVAINTDGCRVLGRTSVKLYPIGVNGGQYTSCKNASIQLVAKSTAGNLPFKYSWLSNSVKNDSTIVNIKNNDTSFVVRIEDGRGCIAYDTAKVITFPSVKYQLPLNPATCAGIPINIKLNNIQGAAPFTFVWDGKTSTDSSNVFTLQQTKNVAVDIIDSNNCKVSDHINITINQNPEPRLGNDKKECKGTKKVLKAFVVSGTKPFNYLWTDGSTNDSFTTTINTVTKIGLQVTDVNGCVGVDTITFDTIQSQNAVLTPLANPFCEEDAPVSLKSTPTIGTWTGAGVNGKIFNPKSAGAGVHPLKFNFTSIYNCPEEGEIYAVVKQTPQPDFTVDKTKGTLSTVFNFTNTTQADTTYTSEWNMGDGSILTAQNPSYTYPKVGTYTVTLKVDNGVCSVKTITKSNFIEVDSIINFIPTSGKDRLNIFPNPVSEILTIVAEQEIKEVEIIDLQGKQVPVENLKTTEINVKNIPQGLYILITKLKSGAEIKTKLLITH